MDDPYFVSSCRAISLVNNVLRESNNSTDLGLLPEADRQRASAHTFCQTYGQLLYMAQRLRRISPRTSAPEAEQFWVQ